MQSNSTLMMLLEDAAEQFGVDPNDFWIVVDGTVMQDEKMTIKDAG